MHLVRSLPVMGVGGVDWHEPIDSVGTERFPLQTMRSLERWAGAEHYAAFRLEHDSVRLLNGGSAVGASAAGSIASRYADLARRDPTIALARRACREAQVTLLRLDPTRLDDPELRQEIYLSHDVCDRVFVCGARDGRHYGLSLIRTRRRGAFSDDEVGCIRAMADTWLSLIAKHERMMGAAQPADASAALLRSVPEIEGALRDAAPALTGREAQVCARILRGMSTPGIAIDLELREDSVATYRKRAYRRLGIGTRFELIQRFVAACAVGSVTRH